MMTRITELAHSKYEFDEESVFEVLAEKEKHRDSLDLKKAVELLSTKIYKDDVHFVLELIQNAEDEYADELTVYLDSNKVIVKNNGRVFSKEDVRSICSIGGGSKKNKIGFMGIGFKSVFHITESPQIISGKYNFTIHDYLYPTPQSIIDIESFDYEPESGAIFVLPLKTKYKDDLIDFSGRLFDVDEKILLFLSSLKKIRFIDATSDKVFEWSYEKFKDRAFESVSNTKTGQKNTWRVFRKTIDVTDRTLIENIEEKEGIEKTVIVLAFPEPIVESINKCKSEPLYCYLPTEKPAQLPFILQADFIPNAGRNDIDSKPRWNTWLYKNLAQHAAESIIQLQKEDSYFGLFYDLIPVADDYYDNELKEKFLIPFHDHLRNNNIVYCKDGNWHQVGESALLEADLDELIGIDDCRAIYESDIFPASISEFTDSVNDVLKYFDISIVDIDDISQLFYNYDPTKKRNPDWFIDIYYYLALKRQTYDNWDLPDVYEKLKTVPFLLSHDGSLVAPFIENEIDRLVTYHPKEKNLGVLPKIFEDGELIFLHKRLARAKGENKIDEKRKLIRNFLVSEYNVSQFIDPHKIINNVILPKFENGTYLEYNTKKLVVLTNYIRENARSWINKKKSSRRQVDESELYMELGERLYLKVGWNNGRKANTGFLHPAEAYICGRSKNRTDIHKIFSWIDDTPFISKDYYNSYNVRGYSKSEMVYRGRNEKSLTWDEFFNKMGAWKIPRVIPNRKTKIPRYAQSWKYIDKMPEEANDDGYTLSDDWIMPEFEKVIDIFNSKPRKGKKLLNDFTHIIKSNWRSYNKFKSSLLNWSYYSGRSRPINNSSFLYALQTTNWLSVDGIQPDTPRAYFLYSEENKNLLPPNTWFIYESDYKAFYRDIGVQEKPDKAIVFAYLKEIKKKWNQNKFPSNYAIILSEIYSYLLSDESLSEYLLILKKYKSIFFPTENCLWWSPEQAFWYDYSNIFGKRRIYLEEYYPRETKECFELLGVEDRPSIDSCIAAIGEMKNNQPLDYDAICYINDIYRYLDDVIRQDNELENSVLYQPIYINKSEELHLPENLFYVDDPKYDAFNIVDSELLYLVSPSHSLRHLLEKAGVHAISNKYAIQSRCKNKNPYTNSDIESIVSVGEHLKPYLQYAHSGMPSECLEVLENLREISVFNVDSIHLDLVNNTTKTKVGEIKNVDAFLHKDEEGLNLFLINDGNPLSDRSLLISHELFRVFWPFGFLDLKLVIQQLLECQTQEDRIDVIRNVGVPDELLDFVIEDDKHVLLEGIQGDRSDRNKKIDKKEIIKIPASSGFEKEVKDTVTKVEYRSFDELTNMTVITNPDNGRDKYSRSVVERSKKIHKVSKGGEVKSTDIQRKNTSPLKTEAHALNIIMSYEKMEGRDPRDVHNQKGIGYDIHCIDRFIEVKSFSGGKGKISITPIEYDAAKKYDDKYYLYIISQITTDFDAIEIEIIQNPIRNIEFEVTGNRVAKKYSGQKTIRLR